MTLYPSLAALRSNVVARGMRPSDVRLTDLVPRDLAPAVEPSPSPPPTDSKSVPPILSSAESAAYVDAAEWEAVTAYDPRRRRRA